MISTPNGFAQICLFLIRIYQRTLSRLLGNRCRFYPTCSHYAVACFEQYPLHKALLRTTNRILRCQPWHPGGVDLP